MTDTRREHTAAIRDALLKYLVTNNRAELDGFSESDLRNAHEDMGAEDFAEPLRIALLHQIDHTHERHNVNAHEFVSDEQAELLRAILACQNTILDYFALMTNTDSPPTREIHDTDHLP